MESSYSSILVDPPTRNPIGTRWPIPHGSRIGPQLGEQSVGRRSGIEATHLFRVEIVLNHAYPCQYGHAIGGEPVTKRMTPDGCRLPPSTPSTSDSGRRRGGSEAAEALPDGAL